MPVSETITGSMTVREILGKYPETEEIFSQHGLTGCGGPGGPVEPIAFFARVHQVDPDVLLRELNEAAGDGEPVAASKAGKSPTSPAQHETPDKVEPDIYRPFVKAAIGIVLTVGCTLGAINLAVMALGATVGTTWMAITQAHGHAQIFGWVGLFIMGVAYHIIPRLKATSLHSRPLAMASFWLVLGGIVLRMIAQPLAANAVWASLVVLSSLLELMGASLFLYVIARTVHAGQSPTDFYQKWIAASAWWFVVTAAATVGLAIYALATGRDAITGAWDAAYLHVGLMGFVGTMILGVTLRTVPAFLGLRAPNKRAFDVLFWVFNASVVVKATGIFLQGGWPSGVSAALVLGASLVEYVSIVLFAYFLNIFRRPAVAMAEDGLERGYEKFIKAAYVWLLVAATMSVTYALIEGLAGREVPHSLVGAYRHALTVGFISMMIVGMASRVIPVFSGVRLYSSKLLLATFVLLNGGNVLRVVSQPLADAFGGAFFVTMGVSGFVEVSALTLFAYNIWRTMSPSPVSAPVTSKTVGPEITPDMLILDVLERFPNALEVFLRHGFAPLANPAVRQSLAKAVTIDMAARMHSINVAELVTELNEAAR